MTDTITKNTENFVHARLFDEGTGHDWWHVHRVRNIARTLHAKEGGDWQIIDLALLLHDVGDRKVINQDNDDYSIAERHLIAEKLPKDDIDRVMSIIKTMSYSKSFDDSPKDTSIEFAIVQDADRLDAIGAIGIARTFSFGGSRGTAIYDPNYEVKEFKSSEEYKKSKGSTYHHFAEKLLLLKDLLNTDTAKKIAQKRHAYMEEFLAEFIDEWDGKK